MWLACQRHPQLAHWQSSSCGASCAATARSSPWLLLRLCCAATSRGSTATSRAVAAHQARKVLQELAGNSLHLINHTFGSRSVVGQKPAGIPNLGPVALSTYRRALATWSSCSDPRSEADCVRTYPRNTNSNRLSMPSAKRSHRESASPLQPRGEPRPLLAYV